MRVREHDCHLVSSHLPRMNSFSCLVVTEEDVLHLFFIVSASGYLREIYEKCGLLKSENTDLFNRKTLQSTHTYAFQVLDTS